MFETGYDTFKKDILLITKIDLNAYKERQMKRRIDKYQQMSLPTR